MRRNTIAFQLLKEQVRQSFDKSMRSNDLSELVHELSSKWLSFSLLILFSSNFAQKFNSCVTDGRTDRPYIFLTRPDTRHKMP